jgi:hypothetical protein
MSGETPYNPDHYFLALWAKRPVDTFELFCTRVVTVVRIVAMLHSAAHDAVADTEEQFCMRRAWSRKGPIGGEQIDNTLRNRQQRILLYQLQNRFTSTLPRVLV